MKQPDHKKEIFRGPPSILLISVSHRHIIWSPVPIGRGKSGRPDSPWQAPRNELDCHSRYFHVQRCKNIDIVRCTEEHFLFGKKNGVFPRRPILRKRKNGNRPSQKKILYCIHLVHNITTHIHTYRMRERELRHNLLFN